MNNLQYIEDIYKVTGYSDLQAEYFHGSTRDFKKLPSFRLPDGTIFLDQIKRKWPPMNPFHYWNSSSIDFAMLKTKIDDMRRVEYLPTTNIDTKVLLDFGCGNGGFADQLYLQQHDPSILLYDNNKRLIRKVNEYFYDMIMDVIAVSDLNDIKIKFDIVTMWHCLEHISSPIDTLKTIFNMMESNGRLFIEVPNAHDFMINKCEEYRLNSLWSEHLVIYSKDTLSKVVKAAGFEIVDTKFVQRYSEQNNKSWINNGYGMGDLIRNKTAYEYSLERDGVSDTILLIARKA